MLVPRVRTEGDRLIISGDVQVLEQSCVVLFKVAGRKSLTFFWIVVSQGYSEHLKTYCNMGSDLLTSDWNLWTIVGEFTTAHTDCKSSGISVHVSRS